MLLFYFLLFLLFTPGTGVGGGAGPIKLIVGSGNTGAGGAIEMIGGTATSHTGGAVTISSGYSTPKSSGEVTIRTSNAGSSGISGALTFATGVTTTGSSGAILMSTGQAVTGQGGRISMSVGSGNVGAGGNVEVTAGQTTAASETGGSVTLTGGAATGGSSSGGSILLTGGASTSAAGGSIIIKPGTGSSAGVTYIQDSGGTTQMQIDGNGITISSTLTSQGTVYALGGIYIGSNSAKALISNIIRGSYTVASGTTAISPGSSTDITVTASGVLAPTGSTYQQVFFSPNQDYETSVKPMFQGWASGTDTLTLRIFNVHTSSNLSPGGSGSGVTFYWVVIQYT